MGNVHAFAYEGSALSAVASRVQGIGTATWAYTYDSHGFLLTRTDPLGYMTSYVYDGEGRVTEVTDPEGQKRSLVYSPGESRLKEKDGGVWIFRYDPSLGRLTEREDPYGYKSKYRYFQSGSHAGRLEYREDPRGKRTSYAYDPIGNVASVTDALGHAIRYPFYNSLNLVQRIEYPGDPSPRVLLDYDTRGNLIYLRDPGGQETRLGYDSKGNLTAIRSPGDDLNDLTDLALAYDSRQYLRSITDNRTGAIVQFEYDSAGNLTAHKDPLTPANETLFEYNGFNRIKKVTDPEGNHIEFHYDLLGNLISVTDANGKTTFYEYDHRGRIIRITDALKNVSRLAYGTGCPSCGSGAGERLTSLTDARGKTTSFQYDLAGRLIRETDPLGKSKTFSYDLPLNRVTRTDEDGAGIRYAFDDLNRLIEIRYPDGTQTTYGYDERGNLTSASNPNIAYTLTYDLKNRLIALADSNEKTTRYEYNGLDRRTKMVTPEGNTIGYLYDSGNRLSRITAPSGLFDLSYDPAGRRTGLAYPNGVTAAYFYDRSGFLTALQTTDRRGEILHSFAYTPDRMGNRTKMTDLAGDHIYSYDDTYQLIRATHPNLPEEQFTYDPVGNRLSSQEQAPASGRNAEYRYDFENRLIGVASPGMEARYKYDPLGRRIEKDVNGVITRYLYDGPNLVAEYDQEGDLKARYTHSLAVDEPLAMERGGKVFYYHRDGLGSVVALTGEGGQAAQRYEYESFGKILNPSGTLPNPFTFTAREYDEETGLYYFRARFYDPTAGRFLTQDPIGFAGGDVNLYRYVQNNPVNFRDPSGLAAPDVHFFISLAAGLAEKRGLGESLRIAWESMWRDWGTQGQLSSDTNIHGGMIGWDAVLGRRQEAHEAIMGALQIIAEEAKACRHGNALHTIQDLQFSWHAGQQWKGWTDPSSILHVFLDFTPPITELWNAFNASRAYLRQQGR